MFWKELILCWGYCATVNKSYVQRLLAMIMLIFKQNKFNILHKLLSIKVHSLPNVSKNMIIIIWTTDKRLQQLSTYRLDMTTSAPRLDSMVAIPLPRPVPPPVTKASLPLKQSFGSIASVTGWRLSYLSDWFLWSTTDVDTGLWEE